jgi:hypothetical protein
MQPSAQPHCPKQIELFTPLQEGSHRDHTHLISITFAFKIFILGYFKQMKEIKNTTVTKGDNFSSTDGLFRLFAWFPGSQPGGRDANRQKREDECQNQNFCSNPLPILRIEGFFIPPIMGDPLMEVRVSMAQMGSKYPQLGEAV